MSLSPGTRLGVYEVVAPLGAGGMGEVYRGRDTRLDRIVAIKVLPTDLAADPQFRERFNREAKAISQLNHPNICTLYDVGEAQLAALGPQPSALETVHFLVLEFLEGETLAARLEQGALKLDEALKIASEISGALDQAHRAGIVHRDLKPGNVMLTRVGAKLLDFGLAKHSASPLVSRHGSTIAAAAASGAVTAEGAIVGTFQYMAPEQLEGVEADARADIFAFGAILYEMVTGRKAFEGKTPVSLITSILRDEPPPVATLLPVAPRALDRIIRACMAKDPDTRLRSTHDLSLQLKWLAEGDPHQATPAVPAAAPAPRRSPSRTLTGFVGGALAGAAIAAGLLAASRASRPVPAGTIQFSIPAPENSVFFGGQVPTFVVSPDGRHVVFVATTPGPQMLFLRSLGTLAAKPLPGTEGVAYPFWSPDSRSIAFFAAGKLKKMQIAGGSPAVICDAALGRGGTWNRDNVIVFAPTADGALARVSAAGGTPEPATTIDGTRGETTHRWPFFLPDGRHFLYHASSKERQPEVKVGALDSKDTTTILQADSMSLYASGHIFFWRDGSMVAQPFDPGRLQPTGDAFRVADSVGQNFGYASFSVSETGVMAYSRGSARPTSQLTWMDRAGRPQGTAGNPGEYFNIALSPDGRRVAATLVTGTPENRDIWLIDIARSVTSRLTFDPASDVLPIWNPDGSRVLFNSTRPGATGAYTKAAAGTGQEELLMKLDEGTASLDWSRDGKFILYFKPSPKTGVDLWVLPLTGDKKPFPFLQTAFNEDNGAFSPDTRWVAYSSNESGSDQVYIQPFPATGSKYQVSRSGGTQPMWRGDGRELFFLAPDGTMMAASITTSPGRGVEAGIPQALFASGVAVFGNRHQYAVTGDGSRFLVNVPQQGSTPTPLTVVVNWQSGRESGAGGR
jgi:eukaryotic-like serine/threonine-protein kinase